MAGLIGYWKFDEGQGTTVADSSNLGHSGTFINGVSWESGRDGTFGGGFNYAIDSYVAVANSTGLTVGLSGFSICAWFKAPIGAQLGDTQPYGTIISKITVNGWEAGQGWILGYSNQLLLDHPDCLFGFIEADGGATWNGFYGTSGITDNGWHHIAFVVNNKTGTQLYIDGSTNATIQDLRGSLNNYSNTSEVRIGDDYDTNVFSGIIDDVRIYDYSLTSGDVQSIYREYLGAVTGRPVNPRFLTISSNQILVLNGQLASF